MATEEELRGIASQLRCPHGEHAIAVADNMNKTNAGMSYRTIDVLHLQDGNQVLELGYGNAGHLAYLLGKARDISYKGLDISEAMQQEALKLNQELIQKNLVTFDVYDGEKIPFSPGTFDYVFTVNTLYFWENPQILLQNIQKVLKQDGICLITFAGKRFMETLPFTSFGFQLYDPVDIQKLIASTSFQLIDVLQYVETVLSKLGDKVEREYYIAVLKNVSC